MKPEFSRDTRIMFTPGAHALLSGPTFQLTPHHQCAVLSAPGDLMMFPGCEATFVVQSRMWTISESAESLDVVLDVLHGAAAPLASPLRVVK